MTWSPQQDAALKAVAEWLRRGDRPVFRLFGYAGTGKTTLARHIAEGVDGDVVFGAYTGMAALVLRARGCTDDSTIHSLIDRKSTRQNSRHANISYAVFCLNKPASGSVARWPAGRRARGPRLQSAPCPRP